MDTIKKKIVTVLEFNRNDSVVSISSNYLKGNRRDIVP